MYSIKNAQIVNWTYTRSQDVSRRNWLLHRYSALHIQYISYVFVRNLKSQMSNEHVLNTLWASLLNTSLITFCKCWNLCKCSQCYSKRVKSVCSSIVLAWLYHGGRQIFSSCLMVTCWRKLSHGMGDCVSYPAFKSRLNSLNKGRCGSDFEVQSPNTCYGWAFLLKLLCVCHRTSLMINQYWFG